MGLVFGVGMSGIQSPLSVEGVCRVSCACRVSNTSYKLYKLCRKTQNNKQPTFRDADTGYMRCSRCWYWHFIR
jgi:hypothetical protein